MHSGWIFFEKVRQDMRSVSLGDRPEQFSIALVSQGANPGEIVGQIAKSFPRRCLLPLLATPPTREWYRPTWWIQQLWLWLPVGPWFKQRSGPTRSGGIARQRRMKHKIC